jgi:aminoglycoside phosphotransferase (APT) family kinase protein
MSDTRPTPADPYGQDEFTDARAGRRSMDELGASLAAWFRAGPPSMPDATVRDVVVPGGGASSDLFLVRVESAEGADRRFAIRMAPMYAVYPVVDLEAQYRVTLAAHLHSAAPVPRPQWYESDARWLGAPFIVTDAAPGVVGGDIVGGWAAHLTPAEQRSLWERSVEALAELHACDLDAAGIRQYGLPAPGATALDRALAYWQRYLAFVSEDDEFPLLEQAVARLVSERPATTLPDVLVWGDARLGNMLFLGNHPSALLDFEFCHVGLREFDVAFFSVFDTILAEHFLGTSRLPGYLDHDETLDHYEAVAKCTIGAREYFTLMACTYSALATTRVLQGRAAAGYVDPSFVHAHGPMAALAERLGAPLESG